MSLSTTLPRKKKKVKEKPQGVTSLRKLLPKPPRKDPPNIIHVKVLPQNIDEEDEDEEANDSNNGLENDNNEMELAKELPELGEGGEHSEIEKENTVKEDILQPRSKDDNSITIDEKMSRENNTDKEKSTVEKGNDKETQVNTPKPKALKKNISRSTPRRNSHIRALSFNTPLKPTVNRKSNTSPKMPKIRFSPRTNKLNNIKRSSLFKSPTSPKSLKDLSRLTEDDENESHEDEKETKNNENLIGKSSKTQTCGRNLTSTQKTPKQSYLHLENEEAEKENSGDFFEKSSLTKIPIATRSPAPKLSNAWKEVNDITITEKPQWDEKIRSFISGDFVDPAPPPKMKTKRKTKEKTSSHEKISKEVSVQENKGERRSLRLTKKNEKSSKKYSTKTNCSSVVKDTPKKVILASSLQSIKKSNHSRKRALKKPHGESQQSVSSREISSSSDGSFTTLNQTGSSLNRYDNKNVDIDSSKPKNDILGKCSDVNEKEPTTEDNVLTTTNNILLEDLVVSSNSCFPQIGDDVGNERNKLSKEISRRLNENSMEKQPPVSDNHTILESDETPSLKTCSPEFALPHVPTLETPLKEFQIITPQTCLNTPMLNIIRQDVSVLEEDLLLTPSLPPTPQVNFFKQPVKTPCKSKMSPNNNHKYNEDKTRYVEQSLHYVSDIKSAKSPTTINENKTQSSCKQIHGINSESINNEPQTTHEKNSKADAIISKKLKQENIITIQKPKNDVISTSTDSSEDDIVNNYVAKLQNNKSNVTVQTKLANKSKINTPPSKTNIYTSSESSNDGIDYTVKNNQTKTNMSKLSSMILQNERKKLDCKTKIPACNKKQKKMLKKCSQSTASLSSNFVELSSSKKIEKSIRKKSKSIDKNSISEEEKEQNSAKQSKKNNSPKISSSVNKFETSLTPEKVRQQLQLDLLKRERQMIFGDGVSFSSDSDTETEVFERKTFVAKKTKSNKSEKLKRKSSQEVNSDISSTIFPTKDQEKEKFEKCAKFENSKQNKATKDSIELKKDDSTVEEITVMIKASSEKTQHELVEDSNKEVLRAVESIALISPCQSSQSTVIKYTERTTYTELSNSSSYINENNSECIENFKVQEHLARSVGSKNIISSVIKDKSLEDNYNTNEEDVNLSNSHVKNNGVHESEITRESEEKDTISEKDLPRPPTPYRINPDNVRNVPNPINQSQFSESSEVEENHIFVVSSTTCTKINTSFCTSEFDPNMKCGFEVDDNKVITASFSEMILHLALPSKTCNHIKKTSQEKIPSGGEISKYPAGKRRVKLTPVCDDKYEQKLKVDYDIDEEGHIINKKGEKRIVSDLDVLDVSCSTIETNISLAENNASIPSSFELITSKQLVKDSKVRENEQKCNLTKNITDRPETSRNENKNCSFSDLKKCEVDNNTTESKYEQYISRERNQHYTCRYDSKMTSSSESAGRPKEGSRRKEADQISLNESVSSEDKRNKYIHRTHSDRRKERESSHRRMDSSHRRRSSEEIKQNKKYFERRRCRDYDRRVYSERRYYTSTRRQRREESSSPESRRRGFKQHTSETSLARCHSSRTLRSNTDKNALFVKKLNVHYEDVDNVEKVGNRSGKDESILNPTVKVDPRSAQIITYSDLEKNESSSDGAPSLMDFAVMHKTKDNRSATISPHSSQQLDVDNDKVDSSLSHKRKALDDGETGLDTPQTHKKLKLGEVEMKEAKSVLKHKMADMLNVLHPDTSNEAS
ncbi:hypothetical protein J6590_041988 [Homalodisca vitripennis]|nr:hypothetical protein J6590_041988 [Homalodisca vitripennis]